MTITKKIAIVSIILCNNICSNFNLANMENKIKTEWKPRLTTEKNHTKVLFPSKSRNCFSDIAIITFNIRSKINILQQKKLYISKKKKMTYFLI